MEGIGRIRAVCEPWRQQRGCDHEDPCPGATSRRRLAAGRRAQVEPWSRRGDRV